MRTQQTIVTVKKKKKKKTSLNPTDVEQRRGFYTPVITVVTDVGAGDTLRALLWGCLGERNSAGGENKSGGKEERGWQLV